MALAAELEDPPERRLEDSVAVPALEVALDEVSEMLLMESVSAADIFRQFCILVCKYFMLSAAVKFKSFTNKNGPSVRLFSNVKLNEITVCVAVAVLLKVKL